MHSWQEGCKEQLPELHAMNFFRLQIRRPTPLVFRGSGPGTTACWLKLRWQAPPAALFYVRPVNFFLHTIILHKGWLQVLFPILTHLDRPTWPPHERRKKGKWLTRHNSRSSSQLSALILLHHDPLDSAAALHYLPIEYPHPDLQFWAFVWPLAHAFRPSKQPQTYILGLANKKN